MHPQYICEIRLNRPVDRTSYLAALPVVKHLSGGSIVLETIKPAEDGRGMILRLYESMGETASGTLRLPREKKIFLSAMDEREETFLCQGKELALTLRPFEIRTLRVTD